MDLPAQPPYGQLPEAGSTAKLIGWAQSAPHNWLGRKFAKLCRALVMATARLPIDTEVEGIRIRAFLRDNNSERRYLFMPWLFDALERDLLAREIPADGVFVDIGANVGIYSLWVARHMGKGGRVLAFEPNPPAFQRLSFNAQANQAVSESWPRFHCIPKGVSDKTGSCPLYLDPENLGGSSLVLHQQSGKRTSIDCVTLLDQLTELGIEHIDALKIDIEGAEDIALLPFFAQAPRVLHPRLIVMERTHQDVKTPLDAALRDAGYQIRELTRMNAVYFLERIREL